ncbi:hypothetical protein MUP06_02330 [Patescibacteria group bacterium]|nr:hypothetical protein [Patescibacteria group bacterium]
MFENLIYLKFIPPEILLLLKIICIVIFLFFLVIIFRSLRKSSWLKYRLFQDMVEFLTYQPYGVKKIAKIWSKIKERLESGSESEYKLAVIEADSMLSDILERMGFKGETLGNRLKQVTTDILPSIEETWEAHKIRNNIVHDPDYKLTLDQAQKALEIYEQALRDLQAF